MVKVRVELGLSRVLPPVCGHHESLYLHVHRLYVPLHLLSLSLEMLSHDFSFREEAGYLCCEGVVGGERGRVERGY